MGWSLPTFVYHADWGTDPKKRWLCKDVLQVGRYRAHAPALVDDHRGFMNRVKGEIGETGTAVVGFDFPIGIPSRHAALLGVTEFRRNPSKPLPENDILLTNIGLQFLRLFHDFGAISRVGDVQVYSS